DAGAAAFNISAEQSQVMLRGTVKDYFPAMRSLYRGYRNKQGKKEKHKTWDNWQDLYHFHGGSVGFFGLQGFDDQLKSLQKKVKQARKGNSASYKQGLISVYDYLTDMNKVVENSVRLAAFKNAVEVANMSLPDAAMFAKELTINFNDKGEWSDQLGLAYLFFNVGVQGPVRAIRALKTKKGMAIAAGISATSFGVAALSSMFGGNDPDDDEPYYYKIPPYVKETNITLMNPKSETGGYFKFPLPYVYNVFWTIGDQAYAVSSGQKTSSEAVINVIRAALQAYSPLGVDDSFMRMISPTLADIPLDITMNRKFSGYPIMPEENYFTKLKKPESEKYFKSVNPYLKDFTAWANRAAGGDEINPTWADVSPEILEYLMGVFTGGVGKIALNTVTTAKSIVKNEPVALHKIPAVRMFYGEQTNSFLYKDYNDTKTELYRDIESAKKGYKEKSEGLRELQKLLKQTERRNRLLVKKMKIVEAGSLSMEQKKLLIKNFKKEIVAKKKKMVKAYKTFNEQ
ncbi:MAG: hypothetical protein JJV89_03010, partial [Desulfosarcina sp.]|nr:hypothetical protein [Desulfobacterales bacterium]